MKRLGSDLAQSSFGPLWRKGIGEPMPFLEQTAEFDNMPRFYRTELVKIELQS
jgi:hypothetical protein